MLFPPYFSYVMMWASKGILTLTDATDWSTLRFGLHSISVCAKHAPLAHSIVLNKCHWHLGPLLRNLPGLAQRNDQYNMAKKEAAITVITPDTTMDRPLMAPSISPISIARAVPRA